MQVFFFSFSESHCAVCVVLAAVPSLCLCCVCACGCGAVSCRAWWFDEWAFLDLYRKLGTECLFFICVCYVPAISGLECLCDFVSVELCWWFGLLHRNSTLHNSTSVCINFQTVRASRCLLYASVMFCLYCVTSQNQFNIVNRYHFLVLFNQTCYTFSAFKTEIGE